MFFQTSQVVVALGFLATIFPLAASQIVNPFSTHDCSSQSFYTGDHACNNDPTKCCAATGICCAGGCCPYDAYCVFVGTANEACCSLSDKTQCGAAPPASTKTCPASSAPSVPCSGVGSSWYCRPHCTCNNSVYGGCVCLTGCSPGSNDEDSSSVAAASSTPVQSGPATAASASSVQMQTSATGIAAGSGSSTIGTASTTTKAGGANDFRAEAMLGLAFFGFWSILFIVL